MSMHKVFVRLWKVALCLVMTTVVAGCGFTALPVTSLLLTPKGTTVPVGSTVQYVVTNTGTSPVNDSIKWSVSDTSVATVTSTGLVSAVSTGLFTITATNGYSSSSATGSVVPSQSTNKGSTDEPTYPIPIYSGKDLSGFPTLLVADFGASGSSTTLTCQGVAGSNDISCNSVGDFAVGQGIRVVGGGNISAEAAITSPPIVTPRGNGSIGTHTYCYVVYTVDPLGAISVPSPQTCISNEPALSISTVTNALTTATTTVGPSPSFLWYVSEDGGAFKLFSTDSFNSAATDMGQRIGSRGGWPDNLSSPDDSIAKNEDLFSLVQAINGNRITLADPLANSTLNTLVDHDDTQAVESTILAGIKAGGANVTFGTGSFNVRRPAFSCLVNRSYVYPSYSNDITLDPWWAVYSYLYIPNGSAGNINLQGASRSTTLITPPDRGGATSLLAMGNERREGAINTPILTMQDVPAGSTQITLKDAASAALLSAGDDVFIYSGSFQAAPDVDTGGFPDMNHFSELNTVASVSGKIISLVYPTSKHYHDDGGSSWGMAKLPITPHDIEIQHLNLRTSDRITWTGDVIGMLVNDVQVSGVISNGAFGGGYKRGVTVENSVWAFGQGTSGWGQTDEYDQFTDLAFLHNQISGYAAPRSEGGSGMAKLYATEGSSQVLYLGNMFDHVSVYADQTNDYYVVGNTFVDGMVSAGVNHEGAMQGPSGPQLPPDPTFLSFDSQFKASVDHNTFNFSPDFGPDWIVRLGDFVAGNVSDNIFTVNGLKAPAWIINSANGTVANNVIALPIPVATNIMVLTPDQSPDTAMSSFTVKGNSTTAGVIRANITIENTGFTDVAPVCIQDNTLHVTQGVAVSMASSIVDHCP